MGRGRWEYMGITYFPLNSAMHLKQNQSLLTITKKFIKSKCYDHSIEF